MRKIILLIRLKQSSVSWLFHSFDLDIWITYCELRQFEVARMAQKFTRQMSEESALLMNTALPLRESTILQFKRLSEIGNP